MVRCPSVPVGSAILLKPREEAWACLFPLPLLSVQRAVLHTLTGDHVGEEVAPLAQLRPPLETSSISILPTREISSCYSFTPIFFRSRNGRLRFHYFTKVGQAQNDLPLCSREEGHGRKLMTFIASLFGAAVLVEQEREI
jgi:hypothetical protein